VTQDAELISESYADTIKSLYTVFLGNVIAAAGSPDPAQQRKAAEQAFQHGIATARSVRDRAIQLLSAVPVS
jgi:hypothetical protein